MNAKPRGRTATVHNRCDRRNRRAGPSGTALRVYIRLNHKIEHYPLSRGAAHMTDNLLCYGDNLDVLRLHVKDESVDLVYLDPPFNSNQDFNAFFEEKDGTRSASQIKAFEDTWTWDSDAAAVFEEVVEAGGREAAAMLAFRTFLGDSDMLAYLSMMAPRLKELRRVMKDGASIYLHCDPTASHYLKMLMDSVFDPRSFQNEIIWSYRRWPSPTKHFQSMHDVLLFYSKTPAGAKTFHVEYEAPSPSYVKRFKGKTQMLDPETGTRKITLDEESKGLSRRDVWDISIIAGSAKERLGYPTQKPEALLERIISASSNPGDVVLDPFCGCGTTRSVAQKLARRWIGIDVTQLAITLIKNRLVTAYGADVTKEFSIVGEPESLEDARALALEDPYQFQLWALGLVNARPPGLKKGADKGIDGRLYFHDEHEGGKTNQIILSVKSGHLKPEYVRELPSIVDRERANIGVLISLEKPTQPMRSEAASAGGYTNPWWGKFPKIQLLTIEELLNGKRIEYPHVGKSDRTFKQAPAARKVAEKAPELFGPKD